MTFRDHVIMNEDGSDWEPPERQRRWDRYAEELEEEEALLGEQFIRDEDERT